VFNVRKLRKDKGEILQMEKKIAKHLLTIGAVELKPNDPFTWTSGIQSPIYCDNRLTLSYPDIRKEIAKGLAQLINTHFREVQVVAGTATAGIPHAAWVADELHLPMSYVRSSAKGHGKQNQIEGLIREGDKVVVIEDLISTGKSSLAAVEAVKAVGAEVLGVLGIFTYGFQKTEDIFAAANVQLRTLTNYQTLIQLAKENGQLTEDELSKLENWKPFN
jgi:orotate phosphoribosyltransferase